MSELEPVVKRTEKVKHGPSTGGPKMADGDWICSDPDCGNLNFARRTACNRCNVEREQSNGSGSDSGSKKKLGTEIGKAAAEKSRGLFSAEDWQCSKCANVNWARRQTCNMCNAPKFTDVEERTGYGGGYNDRGVVEYKERVEESDDEYDEFGRRRKKRKVDDHRPKPIPKLPLQKQQQPPPPPPPPKIQTKQPIEDEEDEEEDDDDDDGGDLSKYDLWGDSDEDVKAKLSTEKKDDRSVKSRSSSSSSDTASSTSKSSSSRSSSSRSPSPDADTKTVRPSRERSNNRTTERKSSSSRSNRSSRKSGSRSRSRSPAKYSKKYNSNRR